MSNDDVCRAFSLSVGNDASNVEMPYLKTLKAKLYIVSYHTFRR